MDPKGPPNGAQMVPKRLPNIVQLDMWGPGAPRVPHGIPNDTKMAPKWHPNGVQIAPKGSNVIVLFLLSVARAASRTDEKTDKRDS